MKNCAITLCLRQPRIFLKYFLLSLLVAIHLVRRISTSPRNCFIYFHIFFSPLSSFNDRLARLKGKGEGKGFLSPRTKANLSNPWMINSGQVIFSRRETTPLYFDPPRILLSSVYESVRAPFFLPSSIDPCSPLVNGFVLSRPARTRRGERRMTHDDHPRAQGENALYFRTRRALRGEKIWKGAMRVRLLIACCILVWLRRLERKINARREPADKSSVQKYAIAIFSLALFFFPLFSRQDSFSGEKTFPFSFLFARRGVSWRR